MKKYKLISLALTGSIILSAMLCGCGSKKNDQNSTAQSSVSSGTQGGDGIKLPDNGGFTTVQYQFSEDKYKTYYEIFPYSFYDSNADGIGDMNGIIQKLDYLNDGDTSTTTDLGVEGIWLMPIMESPSYHKYDVTNYMKVDEAYGTNDDFKKLLDECHKRHVDVIIDLVINHTALNTNGIRRQSRSLKQARLTAMYSTTILKRITPEAAGAKPALITGIMNVSSIRECPTLTFRTRKCVRKFRM